MDAPDLVVSRRGAPLCAVPEIRFGNQPIDGGNLLFTPEDKKEFLLKEPQAERFVRKFLGAEEFINGLERWCLWLNNASPNEIHSLPAVVQRLKQVRQFRLSSKRPATQELAEKPGLFAFISHTESDYLIVPSVSSERRRYIPIGFMPPTVISSNLCLIINNATVYHFGVLSSAMHMGWTRSVCGRLKSDYRYSAGIVYNNFPWPENLTDKQKQSIEEAAQIVLDARAKHPGSSLADLYDPLTMPPELVKAHHKLDAAVDAAYSKKKFAGDSDRVAFLFELYQQLASPLEAKKPKRCKLPLSEGDE